MTIATYIDRINTGVECQHDIDSDHVAAIAHAIESGIVMPLPLVVEDVGNGALVIDGHHRIAAYDALETWQIDALVINRAEFDALIDAEFDGDIPSRLEDLDDYITIDGKAYER